MAAPKKNQFFKLRLTDGKPRKLPTKEDFIEAANEYYQWVKDNPFVSQEITTTSKGKITKESYISRPPSKEGFRLHLGMSESWFGNFKSNLEAKEENDYLGVIQYVENKIEEDQFAGAASGIFSATIISRKLGLADKQQHDHTSKGEKILTGLLSKLDKLPDDIDD